MAHLPPTADLNIVFIYHPFTNGFLWKRENMKLLIISRSTALMSFLILEQCDCHLHCILCLCITMHALIIVSANTMPRPQQTWICWANIGKWLIGLSMLAQRWADIFLYTWMLAIHYFHYDRPLQVALTRRVNTANDW